MAELRDYHDSYAGDRFVKSMAYVRNYPTSLPRLREQLPRISTLVLVIYGIRDPLAPPANAEILVRSLPHARVIALDREHFAWQDGADEYRAAIRACIEGGYRATERPTPPGRAN